MGVETSDSRSKTTKREKLRSAMSHKRAADAWLDALATSQAQWNSAMAKLDPDTAAALDADYVSTQSLSSLYEADGEEAGAAHKSSLRLTMRSAFAHKRLADEMADSMEEWQASYGAMLAKLDAEAGTLNDTNYVSLLAVDEIDRDQEGSDAQHKQSLRRSLRSALADRRLADEMLDAMSALQTAINSSLAQLDAGNVAGAHLQFQVSELDPDSE